LIDLMIIDHKALKSQNNDPYNNRLISFLILLIISARDIYTPYQNTRIQSNLIAALLSFGH